MEDIHIIDDYSRLTLGKYEDILRIDRDESLDDLDIDKQVKILSVLTDMKEDDLLNLPIHQYKELVVKSNFLKVAPTSPARVANSYKIGKFDLIPVTDMRKVTTAQYIDFKSFHQAGIDEHFAEIISCILVPKGKKYNQDYDVIEVQNEIRQNLYVHDGCSLYAFFLTSCVELTMDILTYSQSETMKLKDKEKRQTILEQIKTQMTRLRSNGDG